ncbi:MAG: hypothetical protein GDA43_06595 [Hormoscilla sp. SP5CHS1]|nr:hypothetical protein [Hormoscilla sp. SP12CHS1]MBC6452907.1 hypothetical protein [Hormoscilla sp. SP5CHS1]
MPQPNPQSIAQLLNQSLEPLGITAKAVIKQDCLHILLESDEVPEKQELVGLVLEEIFSQSIEGIPKMLVYGRRKGTKQPDWSEEVDLSAAQPPDEEEYPEVDEEKEEEELLDDDDDEPTDSEEELIEEDTPGEESKPKSADKIKKLLPIAAIILVVLLLGSGVWWFLNQKLAPQQPQVKEPAPKPSTVPTPAEKPQPANQTSPGTGGVDPAQGWRLAINKATSAAELTQTAQTKADWETVASQWTEAIELLKIVPSDHPEYDRAQQKIVEYQKNLEYAQRVAASRP